MESPRPTSFSSRRSASGVGEREVHDVLIGDLSVQQRPLSKTIRIYVSSGWEDCQIEKQYIFGHIVPNLCDFCQSLGIHFYAIDLFSAVPSHLIVHGNEYCLLYELERIDALKLVSKEIKLCQRVSSGPTFVTLLAQKYGYKALWSAMPEQDFTLLLAAVDDVKSKELIQHWYKLDSNAMPHQYVLQSSKEKGLEEWIDIHESLSKSLRRAAKVALGRDVSKVQHYIMSVLEEEATVGIFNLKENPNRCCLWFKRTFSDLMEQRPSSDSALNLYADLTIGKKGLEFDMEAMKALNHLKEARMPAKYIGLDSTNIVEYSVKWCKNKGLDPAENPTHSEYLSDLGNSIQSTLLQMIADTADLLEVQSGSPTYQEALCHAEYCKEKAHMFWERREITSMMYKYIIGNSNVPLVVHGETGSGKTSIMAHVALHMKEKLSITKMVLVLRFIGITPSSFGIRSTLRSICEQISIVFNEDISAIPGNFKDISDHFERLITKATKENPIYIFLDSVDQLSPEDGATGMSWLPLSLPPNVKIILSTSSEVKYRCFPVLQSLMADSTQNFLKIPTLSQTECKSFLKHALASHGRTLTTPQQELTLKVFAGCPLPLYLQFYLREVKTWHSFDHNLCNDIPPNLLKGICEKFLTSLEEKYGRSFISRVLCYITANKYGISEMELLKLLSSDKEVMEQLELEWFYRYAGTALPTVPPLLWSQLYQSLLPFLEFRMGVGQILVYRWSCRLMMDVVEQRYLEPGNSRTTEIFKKVADYFNGSLIRKGEDIPHESTVSCSPKPPPMAAVAKQPIILNDEKNVWNIRKLTELPYCLSRCGRTKQLIQLLTDYVWLNACVRTMPCADIIAWFSNVIPVVPLGRSDCSTSTESDELRLLRDTLHLSVPVLNVDFTQLSSQLLSRLMSYISGADTERPLLKQLVMKGLEDHPPVITPLHPTMSIPGGPLLVTMEGHRDVVSSIATTLIRNMETGEYRLCILSASWDRTLKTWDLKSTGVMKTFDGHTGRVLSVALTSDALYAVSGSADKTVRQWRVETGECLCTMSGHTAEVNAVLISSDGSRTISGSSDATIRVWNSDPTSSFYGQLIYTMKKGGVEVLSLCWCHDSNVAIGYKDGEVHIRDIISAETFQTFKSLDGRAITCLAYVEINGHSYLTCGSEQGSVIVRQMDTGDTLCTLTTDSHPVRSVSVAANGKMTVASGDGKVSVWDLLTGAHLFNLSEHNSSDTHSTSMTDGGSLAITGSADFSIRIWDLKSPPVSHTTRYHKGDTMTVAVSPCGMYAVSSGQDSCIKIYDLETMSILKQLQGHQGTVNDTVILRDSKHLLSCSSNGSICLWNGETEQLVRTFHDVKISGEINSIAISADSELLMSGSEDGQVAFWSIRTGELLKVFTNHKSAIVAVAFTHSASNKYILSASRDGLVCARDFYTAKILLSTQSHTDDLLCLDVSRSDDVVFATGSSDKECHIHSLQDGSLKAVLTGHRGSVESVKIIQGGGACITASRDCTLWIWDIHQSECIASLHTDLPILCCDVDRQERYIVYGTEDGWVSTAFYRDPSTLAISDDKIPIIRRLKGVLSPSTSSFTTSVSSQSSVLDNHSETNAPLDSVIMIDASSIPLPPSDDEELSTNETGSRLSQSSRLTSSADKSKAECDSQKGVVTALDTSPATDHDGGEADRGWPLQVTPDEAVKENLFKKSGLNDDGFVEPEKLPTIDLPTLDLLKMKSSIVSGEQDLAIEGESGRGVCEDNPDSDKNKITPTTSSACAVL